MRSRGSDRLGWRPDRWPFWPPGRRGFFLLLFGIAWCVIALSVEIVPPQSSDLPFRAIPTSLRVAAWLITGLVAIAFAWTPPHRSDAVGFAALYLMPVERVIGYLIAWIDFHVDGIGGYQYAWLSGIFYLLFIGVISLVAGWREAPTGDELETFREARDAE